MIKPPQSITTKIKLWQADEDKDVEESPQWGHQEDQQGAAPPWGQHHVRGVRVR